MTVARPTDRLTSLPKTQTAWLTLALGLFGLLVGPFLGFGLFGLVLATATIIAGVTAYRRGERSWMIWLAMVLAIGVLCYLPFIPREYPYTNP